MSADSLDEPTTHDTSPAATTQSRIQSKQVQSIPSNQPPGNSKPSISLHTNQTSTRVQTYHLSDHVSGHQDSSRDMKKTKPIILAPKKHISSISHMRAMSVCAPCRYARNATKTKKRKNQAKVEIYCSCIVPKYVQYAFWGEASSILLLHRHAFAFWGAFFMQLRRC